MITALLYLVELERDYYISGWVYVLPIVLDFAIISRVADND